MTSLLVDSEGTLWMGSIQHGLACWHDGRLWQKSLPPELPMRGMYRLLEDHLGFFWMTSNAGVLRARKSDLKSWLEGKPTAVTWRVFDASDGLPAAACAESARDEQGRLWFATSQGVAWVDPALDRPPATPPPVQIEELTFHRAASRVYAEAAEAPPSPMRSRLQYPFPARLTLPPGSRRLQVQYTALDFTAPEKLHFQTRLDPSDTDWQDVGDRRAAYYYDFNPGSYVFRVRAVNHESVWNEAGASLAFTVQPFYWQTAWFRVVGTLLIMGSGGGVVWGLVRARLRRALERERLALELHESQERMKLAAEAAGVGVWKWQIASDQVWGSEECRRLFGFAPEDAVDSGKVLQRIHPDDRERVDREVERTLRDQVDYAGEFRVALPDGTLRWISARGQAEFGGDGKPVLMRGAALDVTERKRTEHDMLQKQRELAHLSRATLLGELGGSLAHELNQPLTAMVNNASAGRRFIAKGRADLHKLDGLLAEVVTDGRRAGEILRGIRDMIRKGDEERRAVDVNSAAAEILRLVRADALGRHCDLVTEFDPALGAVNGNPVQLQQVFLNLILNAMDAMEQMPPETRRVIVRTERLADGQVRASVRDFGGGLPPEGPEEVFKPFFSMKRNGMGLGLAIARSIIEAHGGGIAAANAEGGGACFSFWLPAFPEGGGTGTTSPQPEGGPTA